MTKNEFKAWFDGFCEGMEGAPNKKQWERIKARVAEIDGAVTTYPVFVDRYVTPVRPYWPSVPYWGVGQASGYVAPASSAICINEAVCDKPFDIVPNMRAAGSAEYRASLNS